MDVSLVGRASAMSEGGGHQGGASEAPESAGIGTRGMYDQEQLFTWKQPKATSWFG